MKLQMVTYATPAAQAPFPVQSTAKVPGRPQSPAMPRAGVEQEQLLKASALLSRLSTMGLPAKPQMARSAPSTAPTATRAQWTAKAHGKWRQPATRPVAMALASALSTFM